MTTQDDYTDYLDWLDEQPCQRCYEDNRHCVCQALDASWDDWQMPADEDLDAWDSEQRIGPVQSYQFFCRCHNYGWSINEDGQDRGCPGCQHQALSNTEQWLASLNDPRRI